MSTLRRSVALSTAVVAVALLASCTSSLPVSLAVPSTPGRAAQPTATPAPAPTAPPTAVKRSLPPPTQDLSAWAERTVPTPEAPGYVGGSFGWLSLDAAPRLHAEPIRVPAGRYVLSLACLGNGGLRYALTGRGGNALPRGGIACDGAPLYLLLEVSSGGVGGELSVQDGPVAYALALQRTG